MIAYEEHGSFRLHPGLT